MLAAIRVRGSIKVEKKIKDTLSLLRLNRINHCVLFEKNSNIEGMLKRVKNYVTYGEIDEKTLEKLVVKRARLPGNKKLGEKQAKEVAKKILKEKSLKNLEIKPLFRLSPPKKGHKSIRLLYPKGSAGYRGERINELLERMI